MARGCGVGCWVILCAGLPYTFRYEPVSVQILILTSARRPAADYLSNIGLAIEDAGLSLLGHVLAPITTLALGLLEPGGAVCWLQPSSSEPSRQIIRKASRAPVGGKASECPNA